MVADHRSASRWRACQAHSRAAWLPALPGSREARVTARTEAAAAAACHARATSAASLGSGWHPQLTSRCGRYFIYRPPLGTWTPSDSYPTVRINQQTPDLDHSQRSHRRPWPASPPPSGDHRRDACTLCIACRQPEAPPLQRRRAVLRVLVLPPRSVDAPGYVSPRRLAPSAAGGGHALSHSLARRARRCVPACSGILCPSKLCGC